MSGILHRTIFLGRGADGYTRIASWARVITELGFMDMDKEKSNERSIETHGAYVSA